MNGAMDCVRAEDLRAGLDSVNVNGHLGRI